MKKQIVPFLAPVALLSLFSTQVLAEEKETPWYQIEIIAFERIRPITDELMRLNEQPDFDPANSIQLDPVVYIPAVAEATSNELNPLSDAAGLNTTIREPVNAPLMTTDQAAEDPPIFPEHIGAEDKEAATQGAWALLSEDEYLLSTLADKMRNGSEFKLLVHKAWQQPMRAEHQAFPIYLRGSELGDDNIPDFQANLKLFISRYLHAEPSVWLQQPLPESEATQQTEGTDTSAFTGTPENADSAQLTNELMVDPETGELISVKAPTHYWIKIDQKRRMRGGQLHYFDHPLFGFVLQMTPIEDLESSEQSEAANETAEESSTETVTGGQ